MTDWAELKRLAEAATKDLWSPRIGLTLTEADFAERASPESILALIAENERWKNIAANQKDRAEAAIEISTTYRKERDRSRAEVEARRLQVDTLTEWYASALNVINECSAVLPGAYYMDPPDGGDVSIPEQLRRMAKDAERYQWLRDSSESIHQFYLSTPIWFTGVKFSKGSVDGTIDAAMSKGKADG